MMAKQTEKTQSKPQKVTFLDILQSDLLMVEFEKILNIKRGKMMSALKIEKIYDKIHLIE